MASVATTIRRWQVSARQRPRKVPAPTRIPAGRGWFLVGSAQHHVLQLACNRQQRPTVAFRVTWAEPARLSQRIGGGGFLPGSRTRATVQPRPRAVARLRGWRSRGAPLPLPGRLAPACSWLRRGCTKLARRLPERPPTPESASSSMSSRRPRRAVTCYRLAVPPSCRTRINANPAIREQAATPMADLVSRPT